jgi:hypothetical protein
MENAEEERQGPRGVEPHHSNTDTGREWSVLRELLSQLAVAAGPHKIEVMRDEACGKQCKDNGLGKQTSVFDRKYEKRQKVDDRKERKAKTSVELGEVRFAPRTEVPGGDAVVDVPVGAN